MTHPPTTRTTVAPDAQSMRRNSAVAIGEKCASGGNPSTTNRPAASSPTRIEVGFTVHETVTVAIRHGRRLAVDRRRSTNSKQQASSTRCGYSGTFRP
jgi:hypothetical protein